MSESWDRAKELFHRALDLEPAERARLLEEESPGVRAEVEGLLAALERAPAEPCSEQIGDRIGRYRLQQRLGQGGFGTVWMAEQLEPVRRQVALKVVKPGMDTDDVLARFEVERQALALMDHPNIARVLDAGATARGRPFFVMELVRGIPLTRYCDEENLDTRGRLELFCLVCHAVKHAHQKGIIHRDLKPSNVMVMLHDGVPVPKVIDFGIAKATTGQVDDKTLITRYGSFLGTPEYVAPEQAETSGLDVDTRADVYSLGVLLYELVTGTRPFELQSAFAKGYAEVMRVIREEDPPRPSTRIGALGDELATVARCRRTTSKQLGKLVRGDLDWIVMKAIEKDRHRRFDSASAFAEDVRRHLRGEPVVAGPPGAAYRVRCYVGRHRAGVATGAVVATALVLGSVLSSIGFWRASQRESEARTEATRAGAVVELLTDMLGAANPEQIKGPHYTVRQLLDDFDAGLGERLAGEPSVQTTVHRIMGRAYTNLAAFDRARQHLDAALADLRPGSDGDRGALVRTLIDRATVELLAGDYPAAQELLARAERSWQDRHVAPDDLLILLHCSRADVARHQGELAEAEEWGRRAVDLVDGRRAPDRITLTALIALANALEWHARHDEAEATYRRAHAVGSAVVGEDHPDTCWTRVGLAHLLLKQGRLDEAEELLRAVLDSLHRVYSGPAQPVATTLDVLGAVRMEHGDLDEAESLFRESLAQRRALFGDRHEDVATCLDDLSVLLARRGQLDEALELSREALETRRAVLGDDDVFVALSLDNLAFVHRLRREFDAAERRSREALAMRTRLLGDDHASLAPTETALGEALVELGRLPEAEASLRHAVAVARRHEQRPAVLARRIALLGRLLVLRGNCADAEPLLLEARDLAASDPRSARTALEGLVALYERWGKTELADARRRELASLGAPDRDH